VLANDPFDEPWPPVQTIHAASAEPPPNIMSAATSAAILVPRRRGRNRRIPGSRGPSSRSSPASAETLGVPVGDAVNTYERVKALADARVDLYAAVLRVRDEGFTLAAIARALGVSRQAVEKMVLRAGR